MKTLNCFRVSRQAPPDHKLPMSRSPLVAHYLFSSLNRYKKDFKKWLVYLSRSHCLNLGPHMVLLVHRRFSHIPASATTLPRPRRYGKASGTAYRRSLGRLVCCTDFSCLAYRIYPSHMLILLLHLSSFVSHHAASVHDTILPSGSGGHGLKVSPVTVYGSCGSIPCKIVTVLSPEPSEKSLRRQANRTPTLLSRENNTLNDSRVWIAECTSAYHFDARINTWLESWSLDVFGFSPFSWRVGTGDVLGVGL